MKTLDVWADAAERTVAANVELYGRKVAIVSADAPNKHDEEFRDILRQSMSELSPHSFIVGADMNAVCNTDD